MGHNFVASASDLCRIIKICAKYKVREIQIGELNLVFGLSDKANHKTSRVVETKSIEQASQKIKEEVQTKDRVDRLEEDLEELRLTDPLAYERLIGGEIGDVGTP